MFPVSTFMVYHHVMSEIKNSQESCDAHQQSARPYHHGDLRKELLCAAREMLEEVNIASLSLRAVAKTVGVSHTAPYRHFKDKEELLAGIAAIGFNRLTARMATAVAAHPGDPAAQLQGAGYEYVKLALENPPCIQLMFGDILPCDDTYPELKQAGEAAFNGLKAIIEEGQAQAVFKPGDIELLALTTWSGIHGLTLLLVGGNLPDILSKDIDNQQITYAVTSAMLDGLMATNGAN